MTKQEMIDAIKKCAENQGRAPSVTQFQRYAQISWRIIQRHFGSWRQALREAGMEPGNIGTRVPLEELVRDWAAVVRKLGKAPSQSEYMEASRFSAHPLLARFGAWKNVPAGMVAYLLREGMAEDWRDVVEVAVAHQQREVMRELTSSPAAVTTSSPRIYKDRPIFGPAMTDVPLLHGPTNEQGVIFLFGSMARELGFRVLLIQGAFPDCQALREVAPGVWQWVRVEFEYESRNFLKHGHAITGCDVIVCWEHNWPGCPLEVVELKKAIGK